MVSDTNTTLCVSDSAITTTVKYMGLYFTHYCDVRTLYSVKHFSSFNQIQTKFYHLFHNNDQQLGSNTYLHVLYIPMYLKSEGRVIVYSYSIYYSSCK